MAIDDKAERIKKLLNSEFKEELEKLCKDFGFESVELKSKSTTTNGLGLLLQSALIQIQIKSLEAAIKILQPKIEESVLKAVEKYSEVHLMKHLDDMLAKSIDSVLLATIGLKHDWGKWEVDHCNGREPLLASLTKNKLTPIVETFITKNLDVSTFKIPDEVKSAFKREVDERLRYSLREHTERFAKEIATEQFKTILMGNLNGAEETNEDS
jgi:hypothetical protein